MARARKPSEAMQLRRDRFRRSGMIKSASRMIINVLRRRHAQGRRLVSKQCPRMSRSSGSPSAQSVTGVLIACSSPQPDQAVESICRQSSGWASHAYGPGLRVVAGGLTKRWSRLAITSCGMVSLLAASCSTFSLAVKHHFILYFYC